MAARNQGDKEKRAARPVPTPTEPTPTEQDTRKRLDDIRERITDAITGAHRRHFDGVSQISGALNDDLAKTYRDWAAAQCDIQARFLKNPDQIELQQALQEANDAYWNAVRDRTQFATQRISDSFRSYLGAIKDAVAGLDVENVDSGTLCFLAQSLNTAAMLATQQPPTRPGVRSTVGPGGD